MPKRWSMGPLQLSFPPWLKTLVTPLMRASDCVTRIYDSTRLQSRDEHWTGLDLDWILTITNFFDIGLDPDCEMVHKFRVRTGFGLS